MPVKGTDLIIPNMSLHQYLWQKCLDKGDAVFLVDNICDSKTLSYKKIYNQSRTCAAFLHKTGLKVGDVVGLCASSSLEFMVAVIGIMGSGATVTLCNPEFRDGEILQQFRISEPKAVFVHESAIATMKKVKASLPSIENIYVIGKSDEYTTLDAILESKYDLSCLNTIAIDPHEDVAMLPGSSGTTGLPKLIMLTHRNLVAASEAVAVHSYWNIVGDTCCYTDRPMYTGWGCGCVFYAMASGIKIIAGKELNFDLMLKTMEKRQATYLITAPPVLIQLLNSEETDKYDLSSLRNIISSGASVGEFVLQSLAEKYSITALSVYGLTEAFEIAMSNNSNDSLASCGLAFPSMELKTTDLVTAKECAINQNGEILVRGPQVMKGYLKNPEATASTIDKEGWLHTGDIGRIGEDGLLYIVDRLKEVIKYKSVQVAPAELEGVILKHPKVADVGVIGIPDQEAGEVPKALVVKKDNSLTDEEVKAFVKSQLADYKNLRGGVKFVKAIPKSPAGKIQRNKLKKMADLLL